MALYKIVFTDRASRALEKIRDHTITQRLFRKIEILAEDPPTSDVRKIMGSEIDYRIRMGDYRIIYQVFEEEKKVRIVGVGHRKDIYR